MHFCNYLPESTWLSLKTVFCAPPSSFRVVSPCGSTPSGRTRRDRTPVKSEAEEILERTRLEVTSITQRPRGSPIVASTAVGSVKARTLVCVVRACTLPFCFVVP